MKAPYVNFMAGWAIAICIFGTVIATVVAMVNGTDSSRAIDAWMSLWWSWLPVGLLIGFLVARHADSNRTDPTDQ